MCRIAGGGIDQADHPVVVSQRAAHVVLQPPPPQQVKHCALTPVVSTRHRDSVDHPAVAHHAVDNGIPMSELAEVVLEEAIGRVAAVEQLRPVLVQHVKAPHYGEPVYSPIAGWQAAPSESSERLSATVMMQSATFTVARSKSSATFFFIVPIMRRKQSRCPPCGGIAGGGPGS